jgi:predicted RNA-binding Zn-ribbon protein involved in translation (DUF1610 family)
MMGTTILATCPACGEIRLAPDDVVLTLARQRYFTAAREADHVYAFSCPECGTVVRKTASDHVARLLMGAGVMPHVDDVPLEALEPKHGPALTLDDLIDLHFEIDDPRWFDRLAECGWPT